MKKRKPTIIVWDIETSYSLAATFNFFQTTIPHDNILRDWNLLSVAWKKLGENKVHVETVPATATCDDAHLCQLVQEITDEADCLIHHNGDRFDIKKLNARIIYNGLQPIKNMPKCYDTLKIARNNFAFSSNRLDYIAKFLGYPGKVDTPKGMWLDLLIDMQEKAGYSEAYVDKLLRSMAKYNKNDVAITEYVFKTLNGYITTPWLDSLYYVEDDVKDKASNYVCKNPECPSVGKSNILLRGHLQQASGRYKRRYTCKDCGKWFLSKKTFATRYSELD